MREELLGLLEKADLAVASSAGVIADDKLEPLIESVRGVRTRLAYPEDVLVVALAGGTGTGKSSLFNAFAGDELVDVGGVRPTTSSPAAAVPASSGTAMDGYLDRLGVEERYPYEGPSVCLLDLPDTDSVELDHRFRVDRLLPLVDLVVWVADPEKYRDARLHQDYLKPMSAYAAQFLFVLNQTDRLTDRDVQEVMKDFAAALVDDGIKTARVIATSAFPPSGPPIGMKELLAAIEDKGRGREVLYRKLVIDLETTCHQLEMSVGGSLDFDRRAEEAVEAAVVSLVAGNRVSAERSLTRFLDDLASTTDGFTADKLQAIAANVSAHLKRIESDLASLQPPPRRWFRRGQREDHAAARLEEARSLVSEAVIRPSRALLARRGMAAASIADLALEIGSLPSLNTG